MMFVTNTLLNINEMWFEFLGNRVRFDFNRTFCFYFKLLILEVQSYFSSDGAHCDIHFPPVSDENNDRFLKRITFNSTRVIYVM